MTSYSSMPSSLVFFLALTSLTDARIFFTEHFESRENFDKSWISSNATKSDGSTYNGIWALEHVTKSDARDLSLVTKKEAAHYALTKKLEKPFDFKQNDVFVFQYSFKIDSEFGCGGSYVKLYADIDANSDLTKIHEKSRYAIMFGPDKCGNSITKLHFIFQHYNPITKTYEEKHCKQPGTSKFSHIFTDGRFHNLRLILRSDNTFEILLDSSVIHSGSLLDSFDPPVNPPKTINDPKDVKPSTWDDRKEIDDPQDVKPDDWDESQPQHISDPNAKKPAGWLDNAPLAIHDPKAVKPAGWDEDVDGEWVAPLIDNPACTIGCGEWHPSTILNPKYKGKWFPRRISNPAYKGEWTPKQISNPNYFSDEHPFRMETINSVGFELWVLSKNVVFDDIFITNDVNEANAFHKRTWVMKDSSSFTENILKNIKTICVTAVVVIVATFALFKKLSKSKPPVVEQTSSKDDINVDNSSSNESEQSEKEEDSQSQEQSDEDNESEENNRDEDDAVVDSHSSSPIKKRSKKN